MRGEPTNKDELLAELRKRIHMWYDFYVDNADMADIFALHVDDVLRPFVVNLHRDGIITAQEMVDLMAEAYELLALVEASEQDAVR